jgi:hypothetical protein
LDGVVFSIHVDGTGGKVLDNYTKSFLVFADPSVLSLVRWVVHHQVDDTIDSPLIVADRDTTMANGAALSIRMGNAVFQLETTGGGSTSEHVFHSGAIFGVNGVQPIVRIRMQIGKRSAPHRLISGIHIDETLLVTIGDPKDSNRGCRPVSIPLLALTQHLVD